MLRWMTKCACTHTQTYVGLLECVHVGRNIHIHSVSVYLSSPAPIPMTTRTYRHACIVFKYVHPATWVLPYIKNLYLTMLDPHRQNGSVHTQACVLNVNPIHMDYVMPYQTDTGICMNLGTDYANSVLVKVLFWSTALTVGVEHDEPHPFLFRRSCHATYM